MVAVGRSFATDVLPTLFALAFLLGGSQGAAHNDQAGRAPLDTVAYVLLTVAALAFLVRRRAPLVTLTAVTAAAGAYLALDYPYGPILIAVAAASFFVALRRPPRTAAVAGGLAALTLFATDLAASGTSAVDVVVAVAELGWAVIPTIIGALIRVARLAHTDAAEQGRRREVDEERLRLAREVHDVVGHGLSVISLQAGVALHVLDRRPEEARTALEAIRRASTDALDELRVTLALVRDQPVASRAPVSGMGRMPGLLTEVRLCGLPVDVHVEGASADLPPDVDQVAFRVVQEALTNALRHSGAGRVDVTLQYERHSVRILVDDDGHAVTATPAAAGHGLTGLRERVQQVGGRCSAGPRPDGGWRLEAVLPTELPVRVHR